MPRGGEWGEFAVPACRDEDAPQEAKLFWDILQKHFPIVASKVEECVLPWRQTRRTRQGIVQRGCAVCRKFFCRASADCVHKVCEALGYQSSNGLESCVEERRCQLYVKGSGVGL